VTDTPTDDRAAARRELAEGAIQGGGDVWALTHAARALTHALLAALPHPSAPPGEVSPTGPEALRTWLLDYPEGSIFRSTSRSRPRFGWQLFLDEIDAPEGHAPAMVNTFNDRRYQLTAEHPDLVELASYGPFTCLSPGGDEDLA
jgi:hypothetical protein